MVFRVAVIYINSFFILHGSNAEAFLITGHLYLMSKQPFVIVIIEFFLNSFLFVCACILSVTLKYLSLFQQSSLWQHLKCLRHLFFQWMRLDELFEQERNVRMAMSNRMGVLGLMLHQTIDHDPLTPMTPMKR